MTAAFADPNARPVYYRLDADHHAHPVDRAGYFTMDEPDEQTWEAHRRVGLWEQGDVSVSTVFLGIDHEFFNGPPLLFETMVFGGEHDGEQWRCSTWDQALEMHDLAVEYITGDR